MVIGLLQTLEEALHVADTKGNCKLIVVIHISYVIEMALTPCLHQRLVIACLIWSEFLKNKQ